MSETPETPTAPSAIDLPGTTRGMPYCAIPLHPFPQEGTIVTLSTDPHSKYANRRGMVYHEYRAYEKVSDGKVAVCLFPVPHEVDENPVIRVPFSEVYIDLGIASNADVVIRFMAHTLHKVDAWHPACRYYLDYIKAPIPRWVLRSTPFYDGTHFVRGFILYTFYAEEVRFASKLRMDDEPSSKPPPYLIVPELKQQDGAFETDPLAALARIATRVLGVLK